MTAKRNNNANSEQFYRRINNNKKKQWIQNHNKNLTNSIKAKSSPLKLCRMNLGSWRVSVSISVLRSYPFSSSAVCCGKLVCASSASSFLSSSRQHAKSTFGFLSFTLYAVVFTKTQKKKNGKGDIACSLTCWFISSCLFFVCIFPSVTRMPLFSSSTFFDFLVFGVETEGGSFAMSAETSKRTLLTWRRKVILTEVQ